MVFWGSPHKNRFSMKILLVLIFCSALFFGCEMDVEVAIPEQPPKLVVISTLVPWSSNPKFLGVEVYSSKHIFNEAENKPVDNATVRIYRNGDFFRQLS